MASPDIEERDQLEWVVDQDSEKEKDFATVILPCILTDNFPYIMLPDQYEDLKRGVIDHMITLVYENKDGKEQDNGNKGTN